MSEKFRQILRSISLFMFFVTLLPSLTLAGPKSESIRSLLIMSENFINSYPSLKKAQGAVQKEIDVLNAMLVKHRVELVFKVVGTESVELDNVLEETQELCMAFVGSEKLGIEPNYNVANYTELRKKHKADVVFLLIKDPRSVRIGDKNSKRLIPGGYGVACDSEYPPKNPPFLMIEKFGLGTLTLPHEAGHFLGLLKHDFVRIGKDKATLMIGASNRLNLKRAAYFSDSSESVQGYDLTPIFATADIEIIRDNIPNILNSFEIWQQKLGL